jgi:hypothetical protein
MQRRKWEASMKALMGLEGLTGHPMAAICTEHALSPWRYDPWRDQFLAHAANACQRQQQGRREARLGREKARLKQLVGELRLARKKSDARLGGRGAAPGKGPNALHVGCRASSHSKRRIRSGAAVVSGPTCTA